MKISKKPTPSLRVAFHRYLKEVSVLKKSYVAEKSIAKIWLNTSLAQKEIGRISPVQLTKVKDEWLKIVKPATIVRRFSVLSHLFTVAIKDWHMTIENPAKLVRRPSVSDSRDRRVFENIRLSGVRNIPKTEIEWIIRSTKSVELPTIIKLAVETAMRRSEICSIRRENINLTHGVVHLPDTKNGTSRDVPLTPFAREILKKYLVNKSSRGHIFSLSPTCATKAFIRAVRKSRHEYEELCKKHNRKPNPHYFNDIRLHDLRHEATSRLATVFEMHELAKITGHKDTRMLLRYYHPKGIELVKKLNKSSLGKQQLEQLKKS